MSLAELASLSQVAAGLAVIVSLVFFGYELHLTRKQSELANWREVLNSLTAYKTLTNDLEFAEFVIRGHDDYAALTPAELWTLPGAGRSHLRQFPEAQRFPAAQADRPGTCAWQFAARNASDQRRCGVVERGA